VQFETVKSSADRAVALLHRTGHEINCQAVDNVLVSGTGEDADFDEVTLSEELRRDTVLQEVVTAWRERAGGLHDFVRSGGEAHVAREAPRRSCLIFAVDVKHCIALTEAFREAGVQCGYVCRRCRLRLRR
jgi:hypothetical protein